MRREALIAFVAIFHLLFLQFINAEVKLPAIVSSNMVLQRNTTIVLWGWADAGEKITIKASWADELLHVEADEDGSWRIDVKTTNSRDPQVIRISSKTSEISLENVLFGEVWLCSGQSNMQQSLNGYYGQPTFGYMKAIARSDNPDLRLFSVDRAGSKVPLKNIENCSGWQQSNPDNLGEFSAVAYFFGQQLQEILDVPVGMIHSSWGGSIVQAWISKEVISKYQKTDLEDVDIADRTNRIPTALFNAMIYPLIPYTIKGALWYQGESNRHEPAKYVELFPAMVEDWRDRWGIGTFPFYYVQIAPFWYNNHKASRLVDNTAYIREAQMQCLDLIPNSGMAVTMDIGDEYCIHPPKKREVADRLLFLALNQTYGFKSLDYSGPVYESHEIEDEAIIIEFRNAEKGLYSFGELKDFEIAGNNKVFYPAQAKIYEKGKVYVKSAEVPNPVAVRYGWRNWIVGTLYNTNLLPASSFRTDDWNEIIP